MCTFDKGVCVGGGGGEGATVTNSQRSKKIKLNGSFSFKVRFFRFFLNFCRASLISKTMSPRSLKIITSAPQLPENK